MLQPAGDRAGLAVPRDRPPVIVDWLPWNHTFGGNHNFNMMLRNGGTLYIDEGKPAPALLDRTVANLREVAPTIYFNVPRGYGMLVERLEADPALQRALLQPPEAHLLCRRRRCRRACGSASRPAR